MVFQVVFMNYYIKRKEVLDLYVKHYKKKDQEAFEASQVKARELESSESQA